MSPFHFAWAVTFMCCILSTEVEPKASLSLNFDLSVTDGIEEVSSGGRSMPESHPEVGANADDSSCPSLRLHSESAAESISDCKELELDGKHAEALQCCQAATQRNGVAIERSVEMLVCQARCHMAMGQSDAAFAVAKEARSLLPLIQIFVTSRQAASTMCTVKATLATAAMQAGQIEEATSVWTQILDDTLCAACDLFFAGPRGGNLSIRAIAATEIAHIMHASVDVDEHNRTTHCSQMIDLWENAIAIARACIARVPPAGTTGTSSPPLSEEHPSTIVNLSDHIQDGLRWLALSLVECQRYAEARSTYEDIALAPAATTHHRQDVVLVSSAGINATSASLTRPEAVDKACARWPVPATMLDGQPGNVLAECELLRAVWILACDRSDNRLHDARNRLSFALEAVESDKHSDSDTRDTRAAGVTDHSSGHTAEKSTVESLPMPLEHPVAATARRLLQLIMM
eukprot:m.301314 g.301314  ORF g.301314 m.301314 type:complete len:461 (-) comp20138_c0_seq7:180-1562(-)